MTYIGADGAKHRPYMVHRALLGSLERFFGILLEHYAGAFPLWLAPEQIRILPVSDRFDAYAQTVAGRLRGKRLRMSVDTEADTIGAKIRRARNARVPYLLIVGEREEQAGTIAVRSRVQGDEGPCSVDGFIDRVLEEIAAKK